MALAVLITWLQYTFLYDQTLSGTGYFQSEFLVTLLIICLVNLGYFVVYLLKQYGQSRTLDHKKDILREDEADELVVIAQKGTRQFPLRSEQIAYISLESRVLFLTSFENEKMIVSENLDHYEQFLPEKSFFRANRQMIVHPMACAAYESIENGKIRIQLTPGQDKTATVSQKKAAKFREWIKN